MYSGGQNIVDTLYMFYLYALTLGANNFWSVKIVELYLVCNWRLKCFPSISAIKISISSFLTSWGSFLQTSPLQSASSEERLGGDFLLINSCVGVLFEADKIRPHKTKSRDIGYSMTEIDRKHINLQIHTSCNIRNLPTKELFASKVGPTPKTAVKNSWSYGSF